MEGHHGPLASREVAEQSRNEPRGAQFEEGLGEVVSSRKRNSINHPRFGRPLSFLQVHLRTYT